MSQFLEDFYYTDGILNGRGGWGGSDSYNISGCQAECLGLDKYIGNYNISIGSPNIIPLSMWSGQSNNYANQFIQLRNAAEEIICGYGRINKGGFHKIYVYDGAGLIVVANTGWISNTIVQSNIEYDTTTKQVSGNWHTWYSWNDVATPNAGAPPVTRVLLYSNNDIAGSLQYYDDIVVGWQDSNKYLRFPKWQKTKMGMRTWY